MITHMTTHENTRSRHLDILAHHRSSQRAAISTAKRLPARRPSGHGYGPRASRHRADDIPPASQDTGLSKRRRSTGTAPLEGERSEEHTSELQSLMRISYAVFCLKKKNETQQQ